MKRITTAAALWGLMLGTLHAETGETLFDAHCAACHIKIKPTPAMMKELVAPPIFGVMYHVKQAFGGERKAATDFIVAYTLNPSEAAAKCMPQAIRRFGLMPSQQGAVSEADLETIADYLYDTFPPKGFRPPM